MRVHFEDVRIEADTLKAQWRDLRLERDKTKLKPENWMLELREECKKALKQHGMVLRKHVETARVCGDALKRDPAEAEEKRTRKVVLIMAHAEADAL